jgi:hypothetical protein
VTQAPAEQPTTTTLTTGPGPETITPVTIAPAKGQTNYASPAGTSTTTDRSNPGKQLAAEPVVSLAVNGGQAAIDAYRASTSKGEAVNQTGSSNPFGYTQEQLDEFKKKFG